ncbi:unnamed protein product, partial [Musa textilis]
ISSGKLIDYLFIYGNLDSSLALTNLLVFSLAVALLVVMHNSSMTQTPLSMEMKNTNKLGLSCATKDSLVVDMDGNFC